MFPQHVQVTSKRRLCCVRAASECLRSLVTVLSELFRIYFTASRFPLRPFHLFLLTTCTILPNCSGQRRFLSHSATFARKSAADEHLALTKVRICYALTKAKYEREKRKRLENQKTPMILMSVLEPTSEPAVTSIALKKKRRTNPNQSVFTAETKPWCLEIL